MSTSISGTTYTSVSGNTITAGGAANTMGGGSSTTTLGGGGGTTIFGGGGGTTTIRPCAQTEPIAKPSPMITDNIPIINLLIFPSLEENIAKD
jgi:hypothetical protein